MKDRALLFRNGIDAMECKDSKFDKKSLSQFKNLIKNFASSSPDNLTMIENVLIKNQNNKSEFIVKGSKDFHTIFRLITSNEKIPHSINEFISDFTIADWSITVAFLSRMFSSVEVLIDFIILINQVNIKALPLTLVSLSDNSEASKEPVKIVYDRFYDPVEKRSRKGFKLHTKKYTITDVFISLEEINNPIPSEISSKDWDIFTRFIVVVLLGCE